MSCPLLCFSPSAVRSDFFTRPLPLQVPRYMFHARHGLMLSIISMIYVDRRLIIMTVLLHVGCKGNVLEVGNVS